LGCAEKPPLAEYKRNVEDHHHHHHHQFIINMYYSWNTMDYPLDQGQYMKQDKERPSPVVE